MTIIMECPCHNPEKKIVKVVGNLEFTFQLVPWIESKDFQVLGWGPMIYWDEYCPPTLIRTDECLIVKVRENEKTA